jgi:hypothetical protein
MSDNPPDLDTEIEHHEAMLQSEKHRLANATTCEGIADAMIDVGSRESEIARLKALLTWRPIDDSS